MDLSYRGLHVTPVARPMRRERLTLGVACSLNWGPLRRLIGTFRAKAPHIDLIVEDLDEQGLTERVPGRGVDLAVALHDAGSRGWRSAPLWSEPLMVFMAEGHPLAAQNAVQPEQLRETHLLMAGAGSGDRALQRAIIRALGGPPLNERQIKLLNRLLDGFDGKLTSSRWGSIAKCSPDTALRDITQLLELGVLKKSPGGGRSTGYELAG